VDLSFTPEHEIFRRQARRFFQTEYPQGILAKIERGQSLTKADLMESERALDAVGWLATNWPKEYGGTGWSVTERFIFDDELERAGAPHVVPMGLLYAAPVIYTFGSDEQKRRWLPDILSGRTFWAQGYSEPESGSDLASLTTRAVRVGDKYIVNGVKIWTSQAHYADWIFCLVRTSSETRKQDGISFLCIDLRAPGVTVRPIISIDGAHYLNEVSFVDVETSVDNLVGEEGHGWFYARHLLAHERTSYAHVAGKKRQIASLKSLAHDMPWGDMRNVEGGAFHRKLAEVEVALTALEYTTLRALAPLESGKAPGDESSVIKILATENAQAITELFIELAGPYAAPFIADRTHDSWLSGLEIIPAFAIPSTAAYFFARAQTIYGGSTEIQKNIIYRTIAALGHR
jgi:alkylation response protein AidB-like acyl-CoA dehydrogenase